MKKHRPRPKKQHPKSQRQRSTKPSERQDEDVIKNLVLSAYNDLMSERPEEGIKSSEPAFRYAPNDMNVCCLHATALRDVGRFEEALGVVDRALKSGTTGHSRDGFHYARWLRASILAGLGRFTEAVTSCDHALKLKIGADALRVRGLALDACGQDGIVDLKAALEIEPDNRLLHFVYSNTLMRHGDFERGLPSYELRPSIVESTGAPLWSGEPLNGRSILLRTEEGLGDSVFFARFVPLLLRRGARVVFELPEKLMNVAWEFGGDADVIEKGSPLPDCDFECPILSLLSGFAIRTIEDIPPAPAPWVAAKEELVDQWRQRLPRTRGGPMVAIAWSGGSAKSFVGHHRTIPLADIETILSVPGVSFVSVERFLSDKDRDRLESLYDFRHVGGDVANDFGDLAAVLSIVDAVIICDNSAAYVAAAMGKPTHIMLPKWAEWRWFVDRDDSPWYPSVSLFRQPEFGDWATVISRVAAELAACDHIQKPADAPAFRTVCESDMAPLLAAGGNSEPQGSRLVR